MGIAITAIVVTAFFIANALFIYFEEDSITISSSNPIQYPILSDSDLYDYYCSLERPQTLNYMIYIINPIDDEYLEYLTANMSMQTIIEYVRNIPYSTDELNTEYPQYPVETIIKNKGDCEDKSILCAAMLYSKGYDVCLYRFETHMATGVNQNGQYLYIDPTINTPNGEIPIKYKNQKCITYTVDSPILTHDWTKSNVTFSLFKKMIRLDVNINNYALHNENFIFSTHLYNDSFSQYENQTLSIDSQSSMDISMSLNINYGFNGNVTTSIIVNNIIVDVRGGTI